MIKPTVGRMVHFHPGALPNRSDGIQPLAAVIAYVWNDNMVNLSVFDMQGNSSSATSVPLVQEGQPKPHGYFCEWMPFQVGQAAKTEAAKKDSVEALKQYGSIIQDTTVVMQAAWIEWVHGKGAEAAMEWIENQLFGPGLIPDEDEPHSKNPQFYYAANRSNPFPKCPCGNPSSIGWMGKGFCSDEHLETYRKDQKEGFSLSSQVPA